uniref:Uncharacterized protein n=1 Tax=Heliothis virescens TaxID=7102 RepID=A0A2A4ITI8_HELVI
MLPKIPKKHELVVIKHPEELFDNSHDEFIPPVAFQNFAIQANIVNIEELCDEEEISVEERKETELLDNRETLDTAEYFKTADAVKITMNTEISVPSRYIDFDTTTILSDKGIETGSEIYSECVLPVKQTSESNLFIPDESTIDRETLFSDNFVTALEQLCPKCPNTGFLPKEFSGNCRNYLHLKDKFKPTNEFNHALTEQCINILSPSSTDNKLTILPKVRTKGKGYEYIVDSESSQESEVNLVALQNIMRKKRKVLRKPLKIVNSDETYNIQSDSDEEE